MFSSVEEYLGRNTQDYYDVLAEVGQAAWHPQNDARPWIRFMLTAHYRQAKTHLRRIEEIERLYSSALTWRPHTDCRTDVQLDFRRARSVFVYAATPTCRS